MKTAVTQLIERLKKDWNIVLSDNVVEFYLREEQDQIRNAYTNKCDFYSCEDKKENCVCGLKYYNETYTQSSE